MGIVFTMLLIVPLLALLIGMVVLTVFNRQGALQHAGRWLSRASFQTPLRYGSLIFLFNALVFGVTVLIVIGGVALATTFNLPAPMILFAPLAVAASGLGWLLFGRFWQGSHGGRAVAALIGSTFYWALFVYGYYQAEHLQHHQENSMSDVAFLLLQFISFIAAVACILLAGGPRNIEKKRL